MLYGKLKMAMVEIWFVKPTLELNSRSMDLIRVQKLPRHEIGMFFYQGNELDERMEIWKASNGWHDVTTKVVLLEAYFCVKKESLSPNFETFLE
ncbi:unnamed protein product [Linum trigynum]|uniref:Uncharacterized protein n=1 Tax=Linum trigynum TaxID=586398 RepID=A0AAV2EA20_9ROSI